MALVCTVEDVPFLVRYLETEGDAADGVAEHAERYEHDHLAGYAVLAEGEPAWDELHALVPSPGAVGVVCRGPFGATGHARQVGWSRAVILNHALRRRGHRR